MISLTGFSTKGNLMPRVGVGSGASLLVHIVKKASAIQETQFRSLSWEDPLEKEMATHSKYSCLEKSHGQRRLVGYRSWGRKESDTTERLHFILLRFKVLQGN